MRYCTLQWKKLHKDAVIPTKRKEDAGLDIYTIEDDVEIQPLETYFFKTGLASSFPSTFWAEVKERGSTGAINLSVRSGVIDSGYRGEWKIMLTNLNPYPVEVTSAVGRVTYEYYKWPRKNKIKKVYYPKSKAIAQAVINGLPIVNCEEVTDALDSSIRGSSGWGASGK